MGSMLRQSVDIHESPAAYNGVGMMKRTDVYVNSGSAEVYKKMLEVKQRRGYGKDVWIWQIVVDLDKRLTEAEELLNRMRELPR